MKSGTRQIEVLIIAVPKTVVSELVTTINELGLTPHAFEPPPLGIAEAFDRDELKSQGRVLGILELGAGLTNFSILIDGILRFTRNIPITASAFTDDIAEYMAIDKLSAEKLKIRYGLTGLSEAPVSKDAATAESMRVTQAMNFKLEKLVSSIDHTFKFYLYQLSNLNVSNFDKLILSGGGALMKDLDTYENKLFAQAQLGNLLRKLTENGAAHKLDFISITPKKSQVQELYLRFPVEIKLSSPYSGFLDYLKELERICDVLKVNRVNIELDKAVSENPTVLIEVSTVLSDRPAAAAQTKVVSLPSDVIKLFTPEKPALTSSSAKLEGIELSGIIWKGAEPRAIINEQVVKVGDLIGKKKVT